MEEIILESYHEAIIKTLFYRNNFNFQNWEGLFRDVLEVFEKKIDDIPKTLENYVYHQTKEPIGSWPYPLVRFGKEVDYHEPLLYNLVAIEMKTAGSDDVDDDEEHESGHHHLEELEIMNVHES